jgi:peptidyl-prolyl cis-trans isomerase A (cyclophilin A)
MNFKTLAPLCFAALLTACGGGGGDGYSGGGGGGGVLLPVPNPNPVAPTLNCSTAGLAAAALSRFPVVCMLTSSGEMVVELYDTEAPITVQNFLSYTSTQFYTNTLVHRVDRDFVIQGGGFVSGQVPKAGVGAPIVLEDNTRLSNRRGTLAMARTGEPNSATSQWFFNVRDNTFLDGNAAQRGYAIFGQIISGLPVMDAINSLPVYVYSDTDKRPQTEVLVYWVRRVQ